MIITVYIDESGTHDSGVTILGGWVGRLGQWAKFDPQWERLLKRNRLTCFHSKEMRHTQGEFRGWKVHQRQNFIEKAAKIALKNLEFGFTIILNDDDYRKYYIAGYRPKEVPLDSRYGLCFRYCLGIVPTFAKESFANSDLEIHFVLESGHPNTGDANRIFKRVKVSRMANEQEITKTLRTLITADKCDYFGLQVADVNAYSAFQHVTRSPVATTALKPDSAMSDAKKLQKVPVFHLRLQEPELKKFKQFVLDEIEEKEARRKKPNPSSDPRD